MSAEPVEAVLVRDARDVPMRRSGRLHALLMVVGAGLVGGFEWYTLTTENKFYPKLLAIFTGLLLVGLIGLVEPRIIVALGRQRESVPPKFRTLGFVIAVIGGLAGFCLSEWLKA
jgi:hypothetical protein